VPRHPPVIPFKNKNNNSLSPSLSLSLSHPLSLFPPSFSLSFSLPPYFSLCPSLPFSLPPHFSLSVPPSLSRSPSSTVRERERERERGRESCMHASLIQSVAVRRECSRHSSFSQSVSQHASLYYILHNQKVPRHLSFLLKLPSSFSLSLSLFLSILSLSLSLSLTGEEGVRIRGARS
jgi:hypothetical protein